MLQSTSAFAIDGKPTSCERYGQGHINDTYLVKTDVGHWYILQRINHHVFHDIPALMNNISLVTGHLAKADPRPRHVLTLIPTLPGAMYWLDGDGNYWRMYDFITDSICLQQAESSGDFYQSALAFGTFQNLLADFPTETLHETIPLFHNTPNRYALLHSAINADRCNRLKDVEAEVAFALAREEEAATMVRMQKEGVLPLRVTHNDTKLNNVMLDATTREALCVIDLDTVMPGLAGNDFGDSIRFGASTALEDETDLSKVGLSIPLYTTYVQGFLTACGNRLTNQEVETLPLGAKLMTLECGVRFLTDYLSGDTYFHVARPQHNLDRTRTQFALVRDMEAHWGQLGDIVQEAKQSLARG